MAGKVEITSKHRARRSRVPIAEQWKDIADRIAALETLFAKESMDRIGLIVAGGPIMSIPDVEAFKADPAGYLREFTDGLDEEYTDETELSERTPEELIERFLYPVGQVWQIWDEAEYERVYQEHLKWVKDHAEHPEQWEIPPANKDEIREFVEREESLTPEAVAHDLWRYNPQVTELFYRHKQWYTEELAKLTPAEKGLLQIYDLASHTGETLQNVADFKAYYRPDRERPDKNITQAAESIIAQDGYIRDEPGREPAGFEVLNNEDVPAWIHDNLTELRRLVRTVTELLAGPTEPRPGFMELVNNTIYHQTRDVIARGAFDCGNGNKWPTGRIEQKTVTADVQIKPDPANVEPNLDETALREWHERAARQALAMDDDTADVLDYITSEVIQQKAAQGQDVVFSADRFLEKRGLQKQLSGTGRRGGYKTEYRRDFAAQVANLSDVWIRVAEMDTVELDGKGKRRRSKRRGLESRAVVVSARAGQISMTGRIEPDTYRGRLGPLFEESIFGPWRDIALVSLKALGYDRYRERPEKRLTRYLSWQWRIRQGTGNYLQPFEVATLLGAIGLEVSKKNPTQTMERLETALDTLHGDGVIAGWQYCEGWDADIVGRRGWAAKWQGWKIVIEPPAEIMDQYQRIPHKEPKPQPLAGGNIPVGERIRAARKAEGLTQLQAAEDIGINRATLARIERGASPGPAARKSIAAWLDKLNKPNTPQA